VARLARASTADSPTATATATFGPSPSPTLTPTPTSTPTRTPIPSTSTATATPTATPTATAPACVAATPQAALPPGCSTNASLTSTGSGDVSVVGAQAQNGLTNGQITTAGTGGGAGSALAQN